MNKYFFYFFLPFLMVAIISCSKQSTEVYLFRNDKYFSIFDEKKQVYIDANRFFHKKFYSVKDVNVKRFTDLSREYQALRMQLKSQDTPSILFMDNLCLNTFTLTATSNNSVNSKIISYNYEELSISKYSKSHILNFTLDFDLLYNTIIQQIKKLSKKSDYSDTVFIYGTNYPITIKVSEKIKEQYPGIQTNNCIGSNSVKTYLKNHKTNYDVFVVFNFDNNVGLVDLEQKDFNNKHIVEVLTNFGDTFSHINHSIVINEPVFVNHCLHSKYVRDFLSNKYAKQQQENNTKTTDQNNNDKIKESKPNKKQKAQIKASGVTNVPISYSNCLTVLTHKPKGEHLAIKLENKIKENNEKKEKEKQ